MRGYGNVSVHLLTSFMLRSTCLPCKFYHVKHVLLEFTREVRRQNGRKITLGTQILDKCWDYCKGFIPNTVHTKNAKNKLLNAEIWSYVYQWQWRYNHRHALWQGRGSHSPLPIRPYPTILPIDCVIQPFRERPGDKGLLGGGRGTFRGALQTQLKSLPSLLNMSLNLLG